MCISCKKYDESNLVLNIDPLSEAYFKNNVKYYLRIDSANDTIFNIDSVCINKNGLVFYKKAIKGWFTKTNYNYDKLNRIISIEHHSDIHYKSKIEYKFDENSNTLISHNFYNNGLTNSKFTDQPNAITHYIFNNQKLTSEILIDNESKDTINIIHYKYNSNKNLIESSIKNLEYGNEDKTVYKYRENNTLCEIIQHGEIKYISEKTGLIDSVKQKFPNEKITYKYFYCDH